MLRLLIAGCLLVLVAVCAHFSGLWGTWVFDDIPLIVNNPRVHRLFQVRDLFLNRWFAFLTLQLNYHVGGTNPLGYHVVNIGIHASAVIVLWGVLRELLVRRRDHWPAAIADRSEWLAALIAALWAVHPITSQAVTYVIQRAESLWSLAFLVGFYLFLRGSRAGEAPETSDQTAPRSWFRSSLLWSIPCFWLGIACKEPIVATLFALPLCDRLFGHFSWQTWWQQRRVYYGVLFAPLAIALPLLLSRVLDRSATSSGGFFTQTITPLEYWSTQPEAVLIYLSRVLVPVGFCFDYLWPPQSNVALVIVESALFMAALLITIRSLIRGRAWSLLAALFFLCLSTTCLIPLIDLVVEHRMYLASAWLIAGLVVGVVLGCEALRNRNAKVGDAAMSRVLTLVAVVGVILLAAICFQRSSVYQSSLALWEDTADKADWNYRAHVNYANELLKEGRTDEAVAECRAAIKQTSMLRQPPYQQAKVYDALAVALSQHGDVDSAVKAAEQAVQLTPGGSDHLLRLASVYAEHRKWTEAIDALRQAIKNRPNKAMLYQKLGLLLTHTESWAAAQQAFAAANDLYRGDTAELNVQIAQVNWMLGEREIAARTLDNISDAARRRNAWSELASWLAKSDRWEEYRLAKRKAGEKEDSPESLRQQYRGAGHHGRLSGRRGNRTACKGSFDESR